MSTTTINVKLLNSGLPDEKTTRYLMAIRETIMNYYKGSCVQNLASHRDVLVLPISDYLQRVEYWRMRSWELSQTDPKIVLLNDLPLFTMEREKLIIHTKDHIIDRELRKFMSRYLDAIKIKTGKQPVVQAQRWTYTIDWEGVPF